MQKALFQGEICHQQHSLIFVPVGDCEKRKMFLPQRHLQSDSIINEATIKKLVRILKNNKISPSIEKY